MVLGLLLRSCDFLLLPWFRSLDFVLTRQRGHLLLQHGIISGILRLERIPLLQLLLLESPLLRLQRQPQNFETAVDVGARLVGLLDNLPVQQLEVARQDPLVLFVLVVQLRVVALVIGHQELVAPRYSGALLLDLRGLAHLRLPHRRGGKQRLDGGRRLRRPCASHSEVRGRGGRCRCRLRQYGLCCSIDRSRGWRGRKRRKRRRRKRRRRRR